MENLKDDNQAILETGSVSSPAGGIGVEKVAITDIKMPFASMVAFMVKAAIAAIPAIIILFLITGAIMALFGGMLGLGR